jgi:hypothetical protein
LRKKCSEEKKMRKDGKVKTEREQPGQLKKKEESRKRGTFVGKDQKKEKKDILSVRMLFKERRRGTYVSGVAVRV